MAKLDIERFQYIELHNDLGVTAEQLSRKFWVPKKAAASWLSKWAGYYSESVDEIFHFLKCVPDAHSGPSRYFIGSYPWAERLNNPHWEGFSGHNDLEGLTEKQKALVRDRTIRSFTDHSTGKRTTTHLRTTKEKLYCISATNGTTPTEYAKEFGTTEKSAKVILSRWKAKGYLDHINGQYVIAKKMRIEQPDIFFVKPEMNKASKNETLLDRNE